MTTREARGLTATETEEESIATYLQHHPEFFERHQALLARLRLPHVRGGSTISLVERQEISQQCVWVGAAQAQLCSDQFEVVAYKIQVQHGSFSLLCRFHDPGGERRAALTGTVDLERSLATRDYIGLEMPKAMLRSRWRTPFNCAPSRTLKEVR